MIPPFIQNISKAAYAAGDHFDCGSRAIAIEILDPASASVTPKHKFETTHTFEFLDLEDGDDYVDEFGITSYQASRLLEILKSALLNHQNVIVHCTAGMRRSGAVAEIGVMMGFADTEAYRQPNLRVKQNMMDVLGWRYK
jgi:protein-tyrosine phosphatase